MAQYSGIFTTTQQMQAKAASNWPQVPGAPTIGTATAAYLSASVTFTAPADIGSSAITGYTVTSSPGGITATGSSSPITVSGLTGGTSYTFTVTATNAAGTGGPSAASNSATPTSVPTIGQAFGGGYYAGSISTAGNGTADYYLVVAPAASGQSTKQWKTSATDTSGTSSLIDGPSNSANMNNSSHPAAQFCEGLSIGGYTDWYLPAFYELEVLYYFLKPTTDTNNTSYGANPYAVSPEPVNTSYSSGSPGQTSATDFRSGNSEALSSEYNWSSTQSSGDVDKARAGYWTSGSYTNAGKTDSFNTRAVRRVSV